MKGITLLITMLAATLASVIAISFGAPTASALTPEEVIQRLVDTANEGLPTGDAEAFAALFTEDGSFSDVGGGESFSIVGREAIERALGEEPDPDFQVTLIDSAVSDTDGTVTGTIEITDSAAIEAGVERYVEFFTATLEGDLIASIVFTYDEADPQTATYLAYQSEDETEDDFPPGTVTLSMEGEQPGEVLVGDFDGTTFVAIEIEAGPEGQLQPAHVHTGTCDEPGPIVIPLADVLDGRSFTLPSGSVEDLLNNDYIVNVHLSHEEPDTYVSCAPLVEPVGGPDLPPTGTGGSTTASDDSSGLTWLIAALAIGGVMLAGASVVVARRR